MIDIHHHCLPEVDDGPRSLNEAVEMCAMASEEGIEAIVVTPHVLRGRWPVIAPRQLEDRMLALRAKTGNRPALHIGSEYFFAHDMPEVLEAGNAIVPLARSRYVLLELASNSVPPMIEQPLYRAQLSGWIPVLAHPERNTVFQAKPSVLAGLIHHGVRVQITAASLTGDFGEQARLAAERFLRLRLVHFVATDAHNTTKRPPRVKDALEVLRELAGEAVTAALTVDNPAAVVSNQPLPYAPEPIEPRPDGFFTRIKGFFTSR